MLFKTMVDSVIRALLGKYISINMEYSFVKGMI